MPLPQLVAQVAPAFRLAAGICAAVVIAKLLHLGNIQGSLLDWGVAAVACAHVR